MKKLIFVICIIINALTAQAQNDSRTIEYQTPYGMFQVERISNEMIPPPSPIPGLVLTQVLITPTNEPDSIDHLFYVLNGKKWEIEIPSSPRFPWGGLIKSIDEAIDPGLLIIQISSGGSWGLMFVGENYGWVAFEDGSGRINNPNKESFPQFLYPDKFKDTAGPRSPNPTGTQKDFSPVKQKLVLPK